MVKKSNSVLRIDMLVNGLVVRQRPSDSRTLGASGPERRPALCQQAAREEQGSEQCPGQLHDEQAKVRAAIVECDGGAEGGTAGRGGVHDCGEVGFAGAMVGGPCGLFHRRPGTADRGTPDPVALVPENVR